jgi:CRISPR/Cas system-associated exonuclease Cas4 (RecB family)
MTSSYDYIIDNISFSYSGVSSFDTCKWGWKLNYIDAVDDKLQNFFSDYGLCLHSVLESYFKKEIKFEDLKQEYIRIYPDIVKTDPPPYPRGMSGKYYQSGLDFFDSFDLKVEDFDIIFVEDKVDATYHGINLVVKPDLIVKYRKTGEVYLLDYKSSKPINREKWDEKKLDGYSKQMLLYAYFSEKHLGITIDKIRLLFTRLDRVYEVEKTPEKMAETLKWFEDTINQIKQEEDFPPNNVPSMKYFCFNICSVRNKCKYIKGEI